MQKERAFNFSAGPAALPLSVIEEIREELPVYQDLGASILEIGHRTPAYTAIEISARQSLRKLLEIGDEWHILFLQGGASLQFHQVPLNFLSADRTADYLITGSWSKKALKEAQLLGKAHVAASSESENFTYIPEPSKWQPAEDAAYTFFTSNNTIFGTQYQTEPESEAPLVCDASSDFLSRPINPSKYGLVFAGAQKNLGPAGVTLVMIHKAFLERRNPDLPTMLDYGTHAATLFNTPPVFAVYALEKVLNWLVLNGGIPALERRNGEKAALLYDCIDASDFYAGTARSDARSKMNVCFRLADENLEPEFIAQAERAGLKALKGHRSVGGMRASIYNACPVEAVEALVAFMREFERTNG